MGTPAGDDAVTTEVARPLERTGNESGSLARIGSIDGLRAIAFLAVFAFHTWEFAGRPEIPVIADIVGQNIRPDFFVVLTGFVLFMPLSRDPEGYGRLRTGAYLRRRMRRIVLPYYAALVFAVMLPQTLVILMRLMGREASWQDVPGLGDALTHLTFSHLFFVDYWNGINGSLWTMSLEMQLYLLFPLVVVAAHRWGWRALVATATLSVAFRLVVPVFVDGPSFPNEFVWAASGPGRLMELCAGMGAAMIAFRVRRRLRTSEAIALIVGIVLAYLLATSQPLLERFPPLRELALGAVFGGLIVLALTTPASRVFGMAPLRWIGFRAYSLFLLHQPLAWYLSEALKKFAGIEEGTLLLGILWTVGLAVVAAFGQAFFLAVEKPCITWARRVPSSTVRYRAPMAS